MLEPFGESRADLRASVVAQTVAAGTLKKKGGGPFRVEDFNLVADETPHHRPTNGLALKALLTADMPAPAKGG